MTLRAMTWAFGIQGITPTQKFVLVALADHADQAHSCYPSVARLREMTSLSDRAVRKAISDLQEADLLTVEKRWRVGGSQASSLYVLAAPDPEIDPLSKTNPGAVLGGGKTNPQSGKTDPQSPLEPILNPDPSPSVRGGDSGKARTKGSRIPEPFMVTGEMRAWADEEGISQEMVNSETRIFVDYWRGRTGQIAVKADWPATWRNWMRKATENAPVRGGRTPQNGSPGGSSRYQEWINSPEGQAHLARKEPKAE